MRKVNIGIIGCGYWGPNFVRNFSQIPDVKILAICDMVKEKMTSIKNLYRLNIKTYNNYQNLLDNDNLDAVVISTPASSHYKVTKDALACGKHVLVEKPLSIKSDEAEALIKLSNKQNKILMVGHTFIYNAAVNKMKEVIKEKKLGNIFYIHSRRTNLGPLRKDVNAVWDLSPHDISIINYLLDSYPLEVSAYAQKFLSHKLEDVGFIIMKYPGNILVHIHASWLDPKKIREMTIIGSKKMLVYDDININEPIRIYDKGVMKKRYDKEYHTFEEFQLIIKDGEVTIPRVNMQEPLKIECQHFIDCIINNKKPITDGNEGIKVVKILEAINNSYKFGNRVIKL